MLWKTRPKRPTPESHVDVAWTIGDDVLNTPAESRDAEEQRIAEQMAVLLLGVVLVFAGPWMVTAGGPLPLGWLFLAAGLASSIVGGVAYGVAWGL